MVTFIVPLQGQTFFMCRSPTARLMSKTLSLYLFRYIPTRGIRVHYLRFGGGLSLETYCASYESDLLHVQATHGELSLALDSEARWMCGHCSSVLCSFKIYSTRTPTTYTIYKLPVLVTTIVVKRGR